MRATFTVTITVLYAEDLGEALDVGVGWRRVGILYQVGGMDCYGQFLCPPEESG
jgi:hypothetical protein